MSEAFNPKEWLNQPKSPIESHPNPKIGQSNNLQLLAQEIMSWSIDITSGYENWRNIGFALADECGELGRDYFHKISAFHPNYNRQECDKQFDNCLKSKGSGITISTLFHLAKEHGIFISQTAEITENGNISKELKTGKSEYQLPLIPEYIFKDLPEFLKDIVPNSFSKSERDIILLGSLSVLSACFPMLSGLYDQQHVYPNIYIFITAQASAGKGKLRFCRQLVLPLHQRLQKDAKDLQEDYKIRLIQQKGKKPTEVETIEVPPCKMLFIPANNSASGFFKLLSDNEGIGLLFETEGDTMSQAFKQDYGNYSDVFRKAFHHEMITSFRKTNNELFEIEAPRLSALLSGTPNQILSLMPDAENGLFSRFIYYLMPINNEWKDVFKVRDNENLNALFNKAGGTLLELVVSFEERGPHTFFLNQYQKDVFNDAFVAINTKYKDVQHPAFIGNVRRMGLITFRLCMIFSALRRLETGETDIVVDCLDEDLMNSIEIAKTLLKHASYIFEQLPQKNLASKPANRKQVFLERLPLKFDRDCYLIIAKQLGIPESTSARYITEFVKSGAIQKLAHNEYANPTSENIDNSIK